MTAEQFLRWYAQWWATSTDEEIQAKIGEMDDQERARVLSALQKVDRNRKYL